MTTKTRVCIAGITIFGGLGLICNSQAAAGGSRAELAKKVKGIPRNNKNGKRDDAKKQATATAKKIEELGDLMHMFRPTDKGGLGIENDLKKPAGKDPVELANLTRAMAELITAK